MPARRCQYNQCDQLHVPDAADVPSVPAINLAWTRTDWLRNQGASKRSRLRLRVRWSESSWIIIEHLPWRRKEPTRAYRLSRALFLACSLSRSLTRQSQLWRRHRQRAIARDSRIRRGAIPFPQGNRAGGIRTRDLLNPIQALYQAEPRPVSDAIESNGTVAKAMAILIEGFA
jgi:hypothetical protein